MSEADATARLNTIFDQVGGILLKAAINDAEGRPWKRGYLDERVGPTGGGCGIAKWRLELADGEILTELDVARGIATLMTEVFDIRDEAFADKKWYGLLFNVTPDGRCEVQFDYDPMCVTKGFFDS